MPELPHVTAILRDAGLVDATWFNDQARDLGRALHQAAQYLDEGDLEWGSVDPAIVSRLRQYQRFLDEARPQILTVEESVENKAFGYCGRLDRRIVMAGGLHLREGIIDIKSPTKAAWQGVQLAMYAACFDRPLARWTLHLSDERYQLVEHRDRDDWKAAKAALTLAAWRRKHGQD